MTDWQLTYSDEENEIFTYSNHIIEQMYLDVNYLKGRFESAKLRIGREHITMNVSTFLRAERKARELKKIFK